ncbi:translin family protein [Hymenobacter persicinus]|uniref:Uncharacterized protein n=1 Tax=Hymenobacter persicinus TaxID=2025506 RepID=A0A4Q5LCJ1_9BACT|nr:hypothetical protein [Hymenobacter persicinus]RYU80752.1 hypothetical protein EWM57_07830 [Hymenobacter persicinus]
MTSTSPFEYAEVINILAEGLRLGLFTKQQVTQWADSFILRDEQPDIFFIELALSPNDDEALTVLTEAVGSMSAETTPRPLFGAIYGQVLRQEKSIVEAALSLSPFTWEGELLTKREFDVVNDLYYTADLADAVGESDLAVLEKNTLEFLAPYQNYTIENYAHWNELDQEINLKLAPPSLSDDVIQKAATLQGPATPVRKHWWQFWK